MRECYPRRSTKRENEEKIAEQGRQRIFILPVFIIELEVTGVVVYFLAIMSRYICNNSGESRGILRGLFSAILGLLLIMVNTGSAGADPVKWNGRDMPRVPRGKKDGFYQKKLVRSFMAGRSAFPDSVDLLVIRVDFPERSFSEAGDIVPSDTLYHSGPYDSLYYENELRHLKEYFLSASRNQFYIDYDIAPGIITMSRDQGYYSEGGMWEERVSEMMMEVVEKNDSLVDYSRYQAYAVIHAGPGRETDSNGDSPTQLWSGFLDPGEMEEALADTLGTPGIPTSDTIEGDTCYIDNLMIWPEIGSQDGMTYGTLGLYAYQMGLRLGMIPLFDSTPSSFPNSQGIGVFGLMSYGLYNASGFVPAFPCAFHRYLLGWNEAVTVEGESTINIGDINSSQVYDTALVRVPVSESEYFLIANRIQDQNFNLRFDFGDLDGDGIPENSDTLLGAEFDFFLTPRSNPTSYVTDPETGKKVKQVVTGSGLMIWHIDERIILNSLAAGDYPNDDPDLKGVDLEEADGIQDLDTPGGQYSFGSHYDSFRSGNNSTFGPDTSPSSVSNSGIFTGVEISRISSPDPVMSCRISFSPERPAVRWTSPGSIDGSHPLAVDLDEDGVEEIVFQAVIKDTAMVLISRAGLEEWTGRLDTIYRRAGITWCGPPVITDINLDGDVEISIGSRPCALHCFGLNGDHYPIDNDTSEGVLEMEGCIMSLPTVVEADGDDGGEVAVISSDQDSTYLYLTGCSAPPHGGRSLGNQTFMISLGNTGAVTSGLARGLMEDDSGNSLDGFYFASRREGSLLLHYLPLIRNGGIAESGLLSDSLYLTVDTGRMLIPSSGDISGSGDDEMVISVPGAGLVYYHPFRGMEVVNLESGDGSPPVLGDTDGDGILETVLRDDKRMYCFTGRGITRWGWPVSVGKTSIRIEGRSPPAPAVIGDLDGDGGEEIVFSVAGDMFGYQPDGEPLEGFPLIGEGAGGLSPALIRGEDSKLYLMTTGETEQLTASDMEETESLFSLKRYSMEVDFLEGGWRFFRRDIEGSGRLVNRGVVNPARGTVDKESLVIYPNPVYGENFKVRMNLFESAEIVIKIMNLEGEKVFCSDTFHQYGESRVPFELCISTRDMAGGVYICLVEVRGGGWSWSGRKKLAVVR